MSIFPGDDSWRVSVFYSCWSDSGDMLRQFTEAFGVLFGAVCCRGVHENVEFLGDDIPGYFRIQRLLA